MTNEEYQDRLQWLLFLLEELKFHCYRQGHVHLQWHAVSYLFHDTPLFLFKNRVHGMLLALGNPPSKEWSVIKTNLQALYVLIDPIDDRKYYECSLCTH